MMKTIGFLVVFGLVMLAGSCTKMNDTSSAGLYVPTAADTTANASLKDLTTGRELYINNCGRCHSLHSPDEFSASQWQNIISQMSRNTNLSSSEVNLVSEYVSRGKL